MHLEDEQEESISDPAEYQGVETKVSFPQEEEEEVVIHLRQEEEESSEDSAEEEHLQKQI